MDGKESSAFIRNRKEAGAGSGGNRQARQQHVIEAVTKKL
ncbi:LCP family protein [Staphylococcus aureus]|nr:LCP family protein [Staphylococcus aureus]